MVSLVIYDRFRNVLLRELWSQTLSAHKWFPTSHEWKLTSHREPWKAEQVVLLDPSDEKDQLFLQIRLTSSKKS